MDKEAIEYNRRALSLGRISVEQLPADWPGTAILRQSPNDLGPFTDKVHEFQVLAKLDPDAKLGPNTMAALEESYMLKEAARYNELVIGHVWGLKDLPEAWPGTAILAKADLNGDFKLDADEKKLPDWEAFSALVADFQKDHNLGFDGKLGPLTFGKLRMAYAMPEEPGGVIGSFGPLVIMRATSPTCPPEGPKAVGETRLQKQLAALHNRYGGGILESAKQFDLPVAAAMAMFSVEASGTAYDPETGHIIMRFENETVWKKKYGHGEIPNRHRNQDDEWTALATAAGIHLDHAIMSASWGLPQVMGYNHGLIGYKTAMEMVEAFQDDVRNQVRGFFLFCKNIGIDDDIRVQNWDIVVRRYNGSRPDHPKEWVRQLYAQYIAGLRNAYAAIGEMKKRGFVFGG